MRAIAIAILTLLTACIPADELPTRQGTAEDACGAVTLQSLVGLPFEVDDFGAEGRSLRVLPPGTAMTMDHNPARLNVALDEGGIITRIWCG